MDVSLVHEEHNVERVAVNQYIETPLVVRYEGDTMIIPILREEAVVVKRLLLVEELHITKRELQTNSPQQVRLLKEEAIVDRIANDKANQDLL